MRKKNSCLPANVCCNSLRIRESILSGTLCCRSRVHARRTRGVVISLIVTTLSSLPPCSIFLSTALSSPPRPTTLQPAVCPRSMESAQKRKRDKPANKSRKVARRVSVGIRENIPFNKKEVVTRIEVVRKVRTRVLTRSTKVVVPVTPSAPLHLYPSLPSESNHDTPPTPAKQAHKGPSRSAAVRPHPLFRCKPVLTR